MHHKAEILAMWARHERNEAECYICGRQFAKEGRFIPTMTARHLGSYHNKIFEVLPARVTQRLIGQIRNRTMMRRYARWMPGEAAEDTRPGVGGKQRGREGGKKVSGARDSRAENVGSTSSTPERRSPGKTKKATLNLRSFCREQRALVADPGTGATRRRELPRNKYLWKLGGHGHFSRRSYPKLTEGCLSFFRRLYIHCTCCQAGEYNCTGRFVEHLRNKHYRARLVALYGRGRKCSICKRDEVSGLTSVPRAKTLHVISNHRDVFLAQLPPEEAEVLRPILEVRATRLPRAKVAAEAGAEASAGTADVFPMEAAFLSECTVKEEPPVEADAVADPLLADNEQVLGGSGLPPPQEEEEDGCLAQEMVWLEEK